jgi:flagellar hook-associated protein 2
MPTLQEALTRYAAVDGTKGLLINKAGSKYSAMSLLTNSLQTQMDAFTTQISKWTDKMSNKVDYYTKQFTLLEQLTNRMNAQSSALMSFMGYDQ